MNAQFDEKVYIGSLRPLAEYFDTFLVALDRVRRDETTQQLEADLATFQDQVAKFKEKVQKLAMLQKSPTQLSESAPKSIPSREPPASPLVRVRQPSSSLPSSSTPSDLFFTPPSRSAGSRQQKQQQQRFSLSSVVRDRSIAQASPSVTAFEKWCELPKDIVEGNVSQLANLTDDDLVGLIERVQEIQQNIQDSNQEMLDLDRHINWSDMKSSVDKLLTKLHLAQRVRAEVQEASQHRHGMLHLNRFTPAKPQDIYGPP